MNKYQARGLEAKHERFHSHYIRDTRTLTVRIVDFLKTPLYVVVLLCVFSLLIILMSYFADILFLIGVFIFGYSYSQKFTLPFRLPMHSGLKDYNDPLPGRQRKPNQASGIYYFGNELSTKKELWFNNEDMRTHVLIFGSTGSGKTEALISIAYNALIQASGFIYVDGKGDNALFAKLFSMVRSMGREDDLLLINFMTGARDIIGPQGSRLSNTLNPFSHGSSSMLSQLIVSLMDDSSATPDGDMWKGRAIAFVEALMKILVAMRDSGHILLDVNTVRNYFLLDKLEAIVFDKLFPREGRDAVNLNNMPVSILEPITNYILNLPGYNKEKKGKQVSQVLEQHGFITMQLVRVFSSLADTYGHIMRTNLAEVDLKDVVLNRRILCVLLPALEKSSAELSNLGKIIVSSLRSMMAAGLGEQVEGDFSDLIASKPTNARTPFLCILDEYGYYAVEGFAVVPAQARSLGFSIVFSGQDLPAFQKTSKEEAASIGANTNIKVCMKLEDPTETWDFFMKTAGESYVTHVDSFQVDPGSVSGVYADARGARIEKRARIDLLDLKEQRPGEAHFLFKSKLVRAAFFFANPPAVKHMRINHFLRIEPPIDSFIAESNHLLDRFKEMLSKQFQFPDLAELGGYEEVEWVAKVFHEHQDLDNFECAIKVLRDVPIQMKDIPDLFLKELGIEDRSEAVFNICSPLNITSYLSQYMLSKDLATFSQPLLDRAYCVEQLSYIEKWFGKRNREAINVSMEIMNDLMRATEYDQTVTCVIDSNELVKQIDAMVSHIASKKVEVHDKK